MAGLLSLPLSGVITGVAEQELINAAIASLATAQASATAPTPSILGLPTTAGVWWHNTSTGVISIRNQADSAWVPIGTLNESTGVFTPAGVTLSAATIIADLGFTPLGNVTKQKFTSSGTWTKPAIGELALIEIWGAGRGGVVDTSGAYYTNGGNGGIGGGYVSILCLLSDLASSVSVTIGSGGAGSSYTSTGGPIGPAPGQTSFGSYLVHGGGGVGLVGSSGLSWLAMGSVDYAGGPFSGQNGQSQGTGFGTVPSIFGGAGGATTGASGTAGSQPGGGGGFGASGASAGGAGQVAITVI